MTKAPEILLLHNTLRGHTDKELNQSFAHMLTKASISTNKLKFFLQHVYNAKHSRWLEKEECFQYNTFNRLLSSTTHLRYSLPILTHSKQGDVQHPTTGGHLINQLLWAFKVFDQFSSEHDYSACTYW